MDKLNNIQLFELWAKLNRQSNEIKEEMVNHVASFGRTEDTNYLDLIILNAEQIKILKQQIDKLNDLIDWDEFSS